MRLGRNRITAGPGSPPSTPAPPCPRYPDVPLRGTSGAVHPRNHLATLTGPDEDGDWAVTAQVVGHGWCPVHADSPDLAIAKRLLDCLKLCGFQFQRVGPGEDGPLVGNRVSGECVDLIHIEGFSRDCYAWRKRTSSLIVPGDALMERRVHGHALTVLNDVLMWETR